MGYSIAAINSLTLPDFERIIGPVFEHSPWIARRAADKRPFQSLDELHSALVCTVQNASSDDQIALIRAHPDLVGRAVLTAESESEQKAAGLTELAANEVALFDRYNREYKAKFGFPFVICARLNKKDAILEAFPRRLANTAETERMTALEEVYKIARGRLEDLITE
jgi:2-oxo-4-hydroxy-4-carboxy-5-ureidoimidazoline decarboxylase